MEVDRLEAYSIAIVSMFKLYPLSVSLVFVAATAIKLPVLRVGAILRTIYYTHKPTKHGVFLYRKPRKPICNGYVCGLIGILSLSIYIITYLRYPWGYLPSDNIGRQEKIYMVN